MSRWSAFLIHFGISSLIFIGLAYLVLYHWYPDFFFETDGGWKGMQIIIGVDLVLGPLLTLVVFKTGKPGLKMDLTLIGLFQAVCLAIGVYIVYSERPVALVYVDGQFNSLTQDSYVKSGVDLPDFSVYPGSSPKWVQVTLPEDATAESDLRKQAFRQKWQMNMASEFYATFDPSDPAFTVDGFDQQELVDRDQDEKDIPRFLAEHGGELEDYRFYKFAARYEYMFLGFRKETNELAGLLKTPGPL